MKQIQRIFIVSLLLVFASTQAEARQLLPDGLGYSTIDSNEASGPTFNYVDISSTGTEEPLQLDDSALDTPIGFSFNFYGVDYTTLNIASHGILTFLGSNDNFNSNALPIPQATGTNGWQTIPFIAPWFDELDPSGGGGYLLGDSWRSPRPALHRSI